MSAVFARQYLNDHCFSEWNSQFLNIITVPQTNSQPTNNPRRSTNLSDKRWSALPSGERICFSIFRFFKFPSGRFNHFFYGAHSVALVYGTAHNARALTTKINYGCPGIHNRILKVSYTKLIERRHWNNTCPLIKSILQQLYETQGPEKRISKKLQGLSRDYVW